MNQETQNILNAQAPPLSCLLARLARTLVPRPAPLRPRSAPAAVPPSPRVRSWQRTRK